MFRGKTQRWSFLHAGMLVVPRLPDGVVEDRLARLERENAELKKANMEKSETVKKLGVQLVRIRNDWQSQTVPKDLAPAAKAKAVAEASKADRISELELELSRREAYESRLQQQLLVLKQQAGTGNASAGRGPITRQKRQAPTARPASAPRSASAIGGAAAPAGGPPGADRPSSARPAAAGGGGTEGGAGDMRSLLEMLQSDRREMLRYGRAMFATAEACDSAVRETEREIRRLGGRVERTDEQRETVTSIDARLRQARAVKSCRSFIAREIIRKFMCKNAVKSAECVYCFDTFKSKNGSETKFCSRSCEKFAMRGKYD